MTAHTLAPAPNQNDFAALAAVLLVLLSFTGCSSVPRSAKSPAGESRAGEVSVSQSGDAAQPASAASATQTATIPLPEGSEAVFNEKLGTLSVRLSAQSALTMTTRSDTATGPQAFTPPAPPSPADTATGRAVWVYRIALLVGAAAAVFGLVRGWDFVMYGGASVAVAAVIGLFVASHPVLVAVIGAGVAFAAAGVLIWHLRLKKHSPAA